MFHFGLNLGQMAEDSEMFTNIWRSSIGLNKTNYILNHYNIMILFNIHIMQKLSFGHVQTKTTMVKCVPTLR